MPSANGIFTGRIRHGSERPAEQSRVSRSTERTVGSAHFEFELEPSTLRCIERTSEARWGPLCLVVSAEAFVDTQGLIARVVEKRGFAREGIHGFAFQHEYPEELDRGVTVEYFDDKVVVSEHFFAQFVLATVSALEELSHASGRSFDPAAYGRDLQLLRQRLAEGYFSS